MLRFLTDSEDDLPGVGEFDRVAEHVDEDLADPARVAANAHGHLRIDHDGELEVLLIGLRRHHLGRLLHDNTQVEVDHLDVDLSRLDLREVEDVVDHGEQRLRGLADRLRVLALLAVQARREQQAGHPDHPVHRRADLMAHVGQELRLQPRGLHGLRVRDGEVVLDALALGDVVEGDHGTGGLTGDGGLVDDREGRILGGERAPVAAPHHLGRDTTAPAAVHRLVDGAVNECDHRAVGLGCGGRAGA